jgi:uncharacterized protein (DUF1697 family)
MTTYIALLRAINLAGKNKVGMSDLRELLGDMGLRQPRTLLQSGNAVFSGDRQPAAQLERDLQAAARKRFTLDIEFFVRSAGEWQSVIAANPFPREAKSDPGHLIVAFLKSAADRAAVKALQDAIVGREVVRVNGREAYITYPDGMGRSKLTTALIERKLGARCTARNWNTVLKLGALARPVAT